MEIVKNVSAKKLILSENAKRYGEMRGGNARAEKHAAANRAQQMRSQSD